jgi:hypothetical protein
MAQHVAIVPVDPIKDLLDVSPRASAMRRGLYRTFGGGDFRRGRIDAYEQTGFQGIERRHRILVKGILIGGVTPLEPCDLIAGPSPPASRLPVPEGEQHLGVIRDDGPCARILPIAFSPSMDLDASPSGTDASFTKQALLRKLRNSAFDSSVGKSRSYSFCGIGKTAISSADSSSIATRATKRSAPSASEERMAKGECL